MRWLVSLVGVYFCLPVQGSDWAISYVEAELARRECGQQLHIASVDSMSQWAAKGNDGRVLSATEANLPVLVIGAGPGGLAATAALQSRGIEFETVEASKDIGGLWNLENPQSPAYLSLKTNSSRVTTFLDRVAPKGEWPDFFTVADAKRYLDDYAERHGLRRHIWFETRVLGVKKTEKGTWEVQFPPREHGSGMHVEFKEYRAVIVATGHHRKENAWVPETMWGQARASGITAIHASEYKEPEPFRGKRVLIVGTGNSGSEIATEIAGIAKQVVLSVRTTPWIVPNRVLGQPADEFAQSSPSWLHPVLESWVFNAVQRWYVGHPNRLGFPPVTHRLLAQLPIVDRGIVAAIKLGKIQIRSTVADIQPGGRVAFNFLTELEMPELAPEPDEYEQYDAIIFATGYRHSYPFLQQSDYQAAQELQFLTFHRNERGLLFLNEPTTVQGGWPLLAEQGKAVADYLVAEAADAPNVRVFDGLRSRALPDLKGHILQNEGPNYVDPNLFTQFLRDFREWIEN